MTIPFKCVCRTIGLRASLGRFNDGCPAATVSIKDEAVVDELRLRQTQPGSQTISPDGAIESLHDNERRDYF